MVCSSATTSFIFYFMSLLIIMQSRKTKAYNFVYYISKTSRIYENMGPTLLIWELKCVGINKMFISNINVILVKENNL